MPSPPLVYVETTIPSAYHGGRAGTVVEAREILTRAWWREARPHFDVVTSPAVVAELSRSGSRAFRTRRLALVRGLPQLDVTADTLAVAREYVRRLVMPRDALGDALHLAVASVYGCGFLLTWNCKHLANANKVPMIERVNREMGLVVPLLVTPEQLPAPSR